jgi:hypothetical protein
MSEIIFSEELNESVNDFDELYIYELNNLKEVIEKLNKFNQIEVLRILNKHKDVIVNENKYGVHINLTDVRKDIIGEIKLYINYVTTQEYQLGEIEKQKESFKNIYFIKDNKEINVHK